VIPHVIVESQKLKMQVFFKKKKKAASEASASCLAFRNQICLGTDTRRI